MRNPFRDMTPEEAKRFMEPHRDHPTRAFLANLVGSSSVYDFGCGKGIGVSENYTREQYTGFDFSPELVRIAREDNPGYEFRVADVREPVNGYPDYVIIRSVFEHQPTLDDALTIYRNALDTATQCVIIQWHMPPHYPETLIERVKTRDLDDTIWQNKYAEGTFNCATEVHSFRLLKHEFWIAS